jgi:hypothetical protein
LRRLLNRIETILSFEDNRDISKVLRQSSETPLQSKKHHVHPKGGVTSIKNSGLPERPKTFIKASLHCNEHGFNVKVRGIHDGPWTSQKVQTQSERHKGFPKRVGNSENTLASHKAYVEL